MSGSARLKGVAIGAGYFSAYHFEAWGRIPEAEIAALCDIDADRAEAARQRFGIRKRYADWREMLDRENPDFVDIITPPDTHLEMCRFAAERGINIICQKPLALDWETARRIGDIVTETGVRFMVHENWRWQPWYREIKRLLDSGALGEAFHLYFRMRAGDGWGEDAYLARQPFFREYPRLLIFETGIHFIDTFRFLVGEIVSVDARIRRLNQVIKGEDSAIILFAFAGGATAIWDASRYNENEAADPRYTFGELRLDAGMGHLELDVDGNMRIKKLGEPSRQHDYPHEKIQFGGDCVHSLQRHFVEQFLAGGEFESNAADYLRTVRAMEACYESAREGRIVRLD